MKELNNAILSALDHIQTEDFIKNTIEEELKKTIKSIISDQLRSYSDFGKALSEKINTELMIDFKNVNFFEYNKTLLNLIEGIVNNSVTKDAEDKFKQDIIDLFEPPPKEIKLSDLLEKYISENRDDDPCTCQSEQIGFIIEQKKYDKWIGIGLHPTNTTGYRDEPIKWNNCEIYISIKMVDENSGYISWTNDFSGNKSHQFMPTCLHGTSRLLYQMYCSNSILIFDEGLDSDYYDTRYMD